MQDVLHLYFDGLAHPLQLTGCEDLSNYFPTLFPYQDYHAGQHSDTPLISIHHDGDKYHLSASWIDEPVSYTDHVDVLCDLIAKLAVARSFTDLETLYLHAAAVVINGRAVVFPSQYRAGKSFLTACLLAEGHRYIGDDIVPLALDSCKVHSAGISPRLRIPIPETTDEKSRHYIERHTTLAGKRYAYLGFDQEQDLLVDRDESFNIGAFILLEREDGVQTQIEELPVATVFRQLIKHNFAREVDSARILSTLTQVVSNAQCMRLRYDRADEAISLLSKRFSNWPSQTSDLPLQTDMQGTETNATENISNGCFFRNQQVKNIQIEDESFLSSPDGKAIYHLNLIGAGIWELLAEPTSKEDIISTLEAAFPGTERVTIEKDVTSILSRFQLKQLINC